MYEDTYTKYDPSTFEYGQYRQKFITGNPPYAEWDYGDTFHMDFNIKRFLDDPNTPFDLEYVDEIVLQFTIFNYRYEPVYEAAGKLVDLIDDDSNVRIDIYQDLSNKLKPGTYSGQICLKQENIQQTIIRASECGFHVR